MFLQSRLFDHSGVECRRLSENKERKENANKSMFQTNIVITYVINSRFHGCSHVREQKSNENFIIIIIIIWILDFWIHSSLYMLLLAGNRMILICLLCVICFVTRLHLISHRSDKTGQKTLMFFCSNNSKNPAEQTEVTNFNTICGVSDKCLCW